jgi:hypothetical protein
MKPSDELFKLVKSLSKSEKRFFKLASSLQAGDKNYLKLFDAIEKQNEYDEEEIKEEFKKETFIKHLPSEKNHLYRLILKSLRSYHADNSVNSQLQEELKNIEILYNKALYKECAKIIKKAKKLAYEHEKFYYLFETINWEKQLLEEEYQEGNFDRDLDMLISEEQDVIEKLRNIAEYRILYSKINYVFRKGGIARDEKELSIVEEISNHPLIKGKNTALTKRAAATCYYIQGLGAVFKQDYSRSFEHFSKVASIFEHNPLLIQDIPKQYLRSLSNLLFCYIDNRDFKSFFELIAKMRSLKEQQAFSSIDIQMKIFTYTYVAELIACDEMADYNKGLEVIPEIISKIEEYGSRLSKEELLLFYYNIAYTNFGAGNYKEALFWINKILNDNEQNLRQDLYSFSKLFNLVIHYELKNFDLLDYTIKSTLRFYVKRKSELGIEYKFETVFLKHFKKIVKLMSLNEEVEPAFVQMKKELNEALKERYEKAALGYFDFISWIEAKIAGKSFVEVRKEKVEKLKV